MAPATAFLALVCLLVSSALALNAPGVSLACSPTSPPSLCSPYGKGFFISANTQGGSGVVHPQNYLSGQFSITLRLPKRSSAGVNFGFYLMDSVTIHVGDPQHSEIDMEFFGNYSSKAITVALSVIAGGMQNVAKVRLPFDPSAAFHTYAIRWNSRQVVWFIDNSPIRILSRIPGKPWPARAMVPQAAVWSAPWTGVKQTFAAGPVVALVGGFRAVGCQSEKAAVGGPAPGCPGPWNLALRPDHMALHQPFSSRNLVNDYGWMRFQ